MKYFLCVFLYFILVVKPSMQASTKESLTYVAGVVEFAPENQTDLNALTISHTKRYVEIIKSAETKDVDILVFPEFTLNRIETAAIVPTPEENIVPCGNETYSKVVQDISCAVKETKKYVVVNLMMQRNCTEEALVTNDTRPCSLPENNTNIYNTAVTFDRNGAVISTYRKYNLFQEPKVRHPLMPDYSTFETDFGVKFGVFICFDILFATPANELLKRKVKNFVYPTMWYSELPFLTAVQIQQNWAYANNANLLAAGASQPVLGSTGSGIYSGKTGALTSLMSDTPITTVLVATISKEPGAVEEKPATKYIANTNTKADEKKDDQLQLLKEDLSRYEVNTLNFEKNLTQADSICNRDFCCSYDIRVNERPDINKAGTYSYAIATLNGLRTYNAQPGEGQVHAGLTVCALIACQNADKSETCGVRLNRENPDQAERYIFEKIHIHAKFRHDDYILVMPNTLNSGIIPLSTSELNFTETILPVAPGTNKSPEKIVSLELLRPRSDILTFSIFARDYSKDLRSSGNKMPAGFVALITFAALFTIYYQQ